MRMENEEQLEELLARPSDADQDLMRRLSGDVIVVGAGGKIGPSLVRRSAVPPMPRRSSAASLPSPGFHRRRPAKTWSARGSRLSLATCWMRSRWRSCPSAKTFSSRRKKIWFVGSLRLDLGDHRPRGDSRCRQVSLFAHRGFFNRKCLSSGSAGLGGLARERCARPARGVCPIGAGACGRLAEYFPREFGTRCLLFRLNYAVDLPLRRAGRHWPPGL